MTSKLRFSTFLISVLLIAIGMVAQESVPAQTLQKKLDEKFALTILSTDKKEITKAGSIVVLHKDDLVVQSTNAASPPTSTYKDGRISENSAKNLVKLFGNRMATSNDIAEKKLKSGEKLWLLRVTAEKDGVVFDLITDPDENDRRHHGRLKVAFPKGSIPPDDAVFQTIAEVLTVDSTGAAIADFSPIAPPPPPADAPPVQPKTISLGQSKTQVEALFGSPIKVVKLPGKEIAYYPDMKVTFVNNKVTDVQ